MKEIELLLTWRKTVSSTTLMIRWKYQPADWNAVLMEDLCTTAATAIPHSPTLRPPTTGCGFASTTSAKKPAGQPAQP